MNIPGRKYFPGESVFSDWFPRGGDNMILRGELIDYVADGTPDIELSITLYTKNADDQGSGSQIIKDASPTPDEEYELLIETTSSGIEQEIVLSGSSTSPVDGIQEMVRLKCAVNNGADGDYMLVRIFPPIFFDQAS